MLYLDACAMAVRLGGVMLMAAAAAAAAAAAPAAAPDAMMVLAATHLPQDCRRQQAPDVQPVALNVTEREALRL
jgi:hypothetical protein